MATNTDAAVEATARQYYGAQDLLRPGDAELQAHGRASWDAGRVDRETMTQCRDAVRPLGIAALAALATDD